MRVAIVGGGLAGLGTAAALRRTGHEVKLFEQADELRASGLAINFWSNATSLMPQFGIAPSELPGEPVSKMTLRANGRDVACIELPASGAPHVNVDRAPLLSLLARALPEGAATYGTRCHDVDELARTYDLVVIADGANSTLRRHVVKPTHDNEGWSWPIWQACVEAELAEVPRGAGAAVARAGLFAGIWRLPGQRIGWFVEQPSRALGTGDDLLAQLRTDEDPVLRACAEATAPSALVEWNARDRWPGRTFYRGNVVLVGDAAHAMLPTLGQGACQALEDAAELAQAVNQEPTLARALARYQRRRVRRVNLIVGLARAGAVSRRSTLISRAIPEVVAARLMAAVSGPILRRLTTPSVAIEE